MNDHIVKKAGIVKRLVKSDQTYEIVISPEDEDLFDKYKWSALIGRNGHVALHRTEKRKKIYFSREVLARKLAKAEGKEKRPLEKGESCIHLDKNSANKTRDNLGLKLSKALQQERGL